MDYAKATAEQRVHQELVERNYLESQALLDRKDYDAVERLLEAVLQKVDEPVLRKQLEQARAGRLLSEKTADCLLSAVRPLVSIGQYGAAVHMMEEEPTHILRIKRVEEALYQCRVLAGNEVAAMEAFGRCYATADPKEMLASFEEFQIKCSHVPETVAVQELQHGIKQRHEEYADELLAPALEAARLAMKEDDNAAAESVLKRRVDWSDMASLALREQLQQLLTCQKTIAFPPFLQKLEFRPGQANDCWKIPTMVSRNPQSYPQLKRLHTSFINLRCHPYRLSCCNYMSSKI